MKEWGGSCSFEVNIFGFVFKRYYRRIWFYVMVIVLSFGVFKSFGFLISIVFKVVVWFVLWFLLSVYYIKG